MTRTLGVVVSAPGVLPTALALAREARVCDIEVGMFFMADAVGELVAVREAVADLVEDDCEVIACAQSAHERGLSGHDIGILLGSQDDHAALVHRADRLVAFT